VSKNEYLEPGESGQCVHSSYRVVGQVKMNETLESEEVWCNLFDHIVVERENFDVVWECEQLLNLVPSEVKFPEEPQRKEYRNLFIGAVPT
jgi:hypothetical protein